MEGKILVTGATGKVGAEAARLLRRAGIATRALVRRPEHAAALNGLGVELVQGDLEAPESIDRALSGVTAVLLVTPGAPQLERNVIESARRRELRHLVKISNFQPSAESAIPWRRWHAQTEHLLAGSGLDHTIIRPSFFMQNLLAFAPAIASSGSFRTPMRAGRIGMVDARDVAAVAVAALGAPAAHRGKTHTVTGPELRSFFDVATVLSSVLGRSITYEPISVEESRRGLLTTGMPHELADAMTAMYTLLDSDEAAVITDDLSRILGRPARSLARFAADVAEKFS